MSLSVKITLSSFINQSLYQFFWLFFLFQFFQLVFFCHLVMNPMEFIIFSFVNGELFLYVCLIDVSISKVLSNAFFPIGSRPLGCLSVEYFVPSFGLPLPHPPSDLPSLFGALMLNHVVFQKIL